MTKEQKPILLRENRLSLKQRTSITKPITTGISRSRLEDSQISISPMFIAGSGLPALLKPFS
jgi:hypothetical protein